MTSLNGDLGEEATNRGSFGATVLALDRSVPNSTGVARVIGEERGQCAFLICLLTPMVSRTFVRLILNAPTRHPGVLSCRNGFRLQPFFLSKARARTLMSFSSHRIRLHAGEMWSGLTQNLNSPRAMAR